MVEEFKTGTSAEVHAFIFLQIAANEKWKRKIVIKSLQVGINLMKSVDHRN